MINGLLLINKPVGVTSHHVVAQARRILKTSEVGHAGTLDPLASGLLVLLVGEATKLSEYVLSGDKAYRVKVRLGMTTDTLDTTGSILSSNGLCQEASGVKLAAETLAGAFLWPVPMYSAAKVGGKKLYELARENIEIESPVKMMKFWDVVAEEPTLDSAMPSIVAHLHCSKGSFVRTWADQLGRVLGCGAVVEELHRTLSSPYRIENAIELPALAEKVENGFLESPSGDFYISMQETLPGFRALTVCGRDERLLTGGQVSHDLARRLIVEQKEATETQKMVGIKILSARRGDLLSLIEAQPNRGLKIRRVFSNSL